MRIGTAMVIAAACVAAACSYNPPPVPVRGADTTIAALAGHWDGTYESRESGRFGSIVFDLQAGADTAFGDVLMVPRNVAGADPAVAPSRVPPSQLLDITFVRVEGGYVQGRLEPYRDPECGCRLETTFVGTRSGDVIEGTFTTLHLDTGVVRRGVWRVVRRGD